jgi:hypothetical protein
LRIRFEKGTGNLGSLPGDTSNNLYVHVLDKQLDGTYAPMFREFPAGDTTYIISSNTIPVLSTNPKSPIRGTLDIRITKFEVDNMQDLTKQGIVRFEIYMFDRDLVQSNIVTTPEIRIR